MPPLQLGDRVFSTRIFAPTLRSNDPAGIDSETTQS
jgi:hypothetical protein